MALREILAKFGIDVDSKKLKDADSAISKLATNIKEVGGLMVGGAIIGGLKGFVGEMTDLEGHITDTSAQLGISTDAFQRWELATKLAGAGSEDFTAALRVLQKNMGAAASGEKGATEAFGKLGVKITDANGHMRDSSDVFKDVGLAIAKMPNQAQRTAALMQLLGKGGAKLGPLFNQGEEGMQKLLGALDEAGGPIGQDALESIGATGDALDKFEASTKGLKATIAANFFPALTAMISYITKAAVSFRKATKDTEILKAAFIVLGAIAARQALLMYARYLPFLLLVGLLVLLVDDLLTFFKGGDSLIGRFLDAVLGAGSASEIAKEMRKDFRDLRHELDRIPGAGQKLEHALRKIGDSIKKFFTNDLPQAWQTFWEQMNEQDKTGGKTFGDFWAKILAESAERMKDGAKDIIKALIDAIKAELDKAADTASQYFKDFLQKAEETVLDVTGISQTSNLGNTAQSTVDRGKGAVQQGVDTVKGGVSKGVNKIKGLLGLGSLNIVNHIESIDIRTNDAKGVLKAAREGAGKALDDSNRATLSSLETVVVT